MVCAYCGMELDGPGACPVCGFSETKLIGETEIIVSARKGYPVVVLYANDPEVWHFYETMPDHDDFSINKFNPKTDGVYAVTVSFGLVPSRHGYTCEYVKDFLIYAYEWKK